MSIAEPPPALDVEVASSPQAFEDVASDWQAVWSASQPRNPFLSHEWHVAWWDSLGSGAPDLLVARRDGQPVAIGPFVRRADGVHSFSGGDLTDVLDILAPDARAITVLGRHLAREATAIELSYLPQGSPTLDILPALLRDASFAVDLLPLVVSPRISVPASFEDYISGLGKKERHELRRKLRRASEHGTLAFGFAEDEPAREAALDRFVRWHRQAPGDKAEFLTPERERFFRGLARGGARAGWLRLGELRVDDRPIAVLFAVEADGTLAAYNSAVDPAMTALSPGILLHAYALRSAIDRGLAAYDLLRGDERYKYELGARDLTLMRLTARRTP